MRSVRKQLLTLATLVGLIGTAGLLAPTGAEADGGPVIAPSSPPYNVITMESGTPATGFADWGAWVLGAPTDTISSRTEGISLQIVAERPQTSSSVAFQFAPPEGATWGVGRYATLHNVDATHAAMNIAADGNSCPSTGIEGSLDVHEVTTDGSGNVTAFAASYSMLCYDAQVTGEVRLNSTVPYAAADVTSADFGTVEESEPTAPRAITVRSAGPTPTHITGPAMLTGDGAPSFAIVSDGCEGMTLTGQQSCTVMVRADAAALGSVAAGLQLPDNSTAGHATAQLRLNGEAWRGTFTPIHPHRILDTRLGAGAPEAPLAAGSVIHLKVTGDLGAGYEVPVTGVLAVVLNLTETGGTSSGYVSAYPTGTARPNASNINYVAGGTRANLVTVQVGAGGDVDLYNSAGHVNLIADISGYFITGRDPSVVGPGSALRLVPPRRLLDTRTWSPSGLKPRAHDDVLVDEGDGTNPYMTAALVTVTAVQPTGGGYVSAYRSGGNPTLTSTLNLVPGVTTPNLAVVPVTMCQSGWCAEKPTISVYNGSATPTNVLVDLLGVFSTTGTQPGLRYKPVTPTRIVDTRYHVGASPLGPQSTTLIHAPASIVDAWTGALVVNVTAIRPTNSTHLTLWPDLSGGPRPNISSSNPAAQSTVANSTMTGLGSGGSFGVYNGSGTTNVAIDVAGTYEFLPSDYPGGYVP